VSVTDSRDSVGRSAENPDARQRPGTKGNTASGNVTKPATLEAGLEIGVPLFSKEEQKVKVHTETPEFAGRA
jgi:elongation factor P